MNKNFFLKRIYALCRQQNITAQELIKKSKLVPKTLYYWEKNKAIPSIDSIEKICTALGINISSFFEGYSENKLHSEQLNLITDWGELTEIEKLALKKIILTFKKADL